MSQLQKFEEKFVTFEKLNFSLMLNHNVYYCTVFYHEVSWDILQTQSQM